MNSLLPHSSPWWRSMSKRPPIRLFGSWSSAKVFQFIAPARLHNAAGRVTTLPGPSKAAQRIIPRQPLIVTGASFWWLYTITGALATIPLLVPLTGCLWVHLQSFSASGCRLLPILYI
jgi:4-amino-4-deoxy-L-arabinose transferase-like glycosyltransferase